MSPLRLLAQSTRAAMWLDKTEGSFLRKWSALMEIFSRMRQTRSRPACNLHSVNVHGQDMPLTEEAVMALPFGTLLRFRKDASIDRSW